MNVCLAVGPGIDWSSVQAVPHLSPYESWERLQPLCNSELDKQGEKSDSCMDGYLVHYVLAQLICQVSNSFTH